MKRRLAPQAVAEKMWCVADLNDDYIASMEDVLEVYERPYEASSRWSVWMRSRFLYMQKSVRRRRPNQVGKRGGIASGNGAALPMFSVQWSQRRGAISFSPLRIARLSNLLKCCSTRRLHIRRLRPFTW